MSLWHRTDIAMRVHYETLVKVKLFRNCEPGMISDLVALLSPMFYLSGDLVCMKNDIGKEMYIIKSGRVQVQRVHQKTNILGCSFLVFPRGWKVKFFLSNESH